MPCGGTSIYNRPKGGFLMVPGKDSYEKWQRSFFYVKNTHPKVDDINLPAFTAEAPHARRN
jgi:hypothetical protein